MGANLAEFFITLLGIPIPPGIAAGGAIAIVTAVTGILCKAKYAGDMLLNPNPLISKDRKLEANTYDFIIGR